MVTVKCRVNGCLGDFDSKRGGAVCSAQASAKHCANNYTTPMPDFGEKLGEGHLLCTLRYFSCVSAKN